MTATRNGPNFPPPKSRFCWKRRNAPAPAIFPATRKTANGWRG